MRLFLLGILLSLGMHIGHAQTIVGNYGIQYVAAIPTGACSTNSAIQVYITTGTIYTCKSGTWAAVGSGGGTPSGPAGGDLGGTFPNPTVTAIHMACGSSGTNFACLTANNVMAGNNTLGQASGSQTIIYAGDPFTNYFRILSNTGQILAIDPTDILATTGLKIYTNNGTSVSIGTNSTMGLTVTPNQGVVVGTTTFAGTDPGTGNLAVQNSIVSPTYLTPTSFVGRSQTTALSQTIVASASTATYRIAMATNCKTAVSSASYTSTVSYTDTSNTVQTIGTGVITCTTLGTATQSNSITVANVLSGTAISLSTSTSGAVSYDVAVMVDKITSN